MDKLLKIKISEKDVLFFLLAVVFTTVFRASLLVIYPVLVIFLFYLFRWRIRWDGIYLVVLVLLFWLFSFRNGFYPLYNLFSFFYFIPFILLLFANPHPVSADADNLHKFMRALAVVVIPGNIAGIVQYIQYPTDDSFKGFYGAFTVSQNGLSLINCILFIYYFFRFQRSKKTGTLILSIFFIVCGVMGFYGAGMIVFLASLAVVYLRFTVKNIIKFIFSIGFLVLAVYFLMKWISPNTLQYNLNILKKFYDGITTSVSAPRKLVIFNKYYDSYTDRPLDLLFGSGPGTFNSRSAFMVGSPSYFNVSFIKSTNVPYHFLNEAYPLWNPAVVTRYDGFMSQPFTSLLSLAGEYGLIVSGLIFWLTLRNYRRISRAALQASVDFIILRFYKFLSVFLLLLVIIDNYIEYPEVIALIMILLKLCEGSILAKRLEKPLEK